jgi:hypothetical protein
MMRPPSAQHRASAPQDWFIGRQVSALSVLAKKNVLQIATRSRAIARSGRVLPRQQQQP